MDTQLLQITPFVKRPTFPSVLSLLMVVPLARKAYGAHPARVIHRELHWHFFHWGHYLWLGQLAVFMIDLQVTGRGTAQAYKCSEDKYIGHEGCEGRGKMVQNKEGCQRLIIEERMLDYEVQNGTTGSFLLLISIYLSLLLSHQIWMDSTSDLQ